METLQHLLLSIYFLGSIFHCYTDIKEQLLYDEISLAMLAAGLTYMGCMHKLWEGIYGCGITGIIFFLLFGFSGGGMGFGDVKLAVVLGAWLGWREGLLSLLLALLLGTVGGGLLLLSGRKKVEDAMPFGPYMCLSGGLMLAYGKELIAVYEGLLMLN